MPTSIIHDPEELHRIGERIVRAREAKGLSQKDFASQVQVPASVMSNIEKGKRLVPKLKIGLLAQKLGLTEDELRSSTALAMQEVRDDLKALEQQIGIGFRALQALPEEAKKELIEKFKELKNRYEKDDGTLTVKETPAQAASKVLKKCQIKSLPIDLDRIARQYSMVIAPSSTIDADGWIVYSKDQKLASIKYRDGMKTGRKRFTIAHEMGHFFLQNLNQDDEQSCQIDGPKKPELEREADEFASHLLMPEDLVKSLVGSRISGYEDILKISHTGEVSQQAAALRLMQVTGSLAAAIYSEASEIRWGRTSSRMHLRVKRDQRVSRLSQANRILQREGQGLVRAVETKADYWFYGRMTGKLMEHSSRLYEDKILTLVWKR